MKDQVIRARVSAAHKERLRALSVQEGLPESELIRRFVERGLSGQEGEGALGTGSGFSSASGSTPLTVPGPVFSRQKVSLRLPGFVLDAVKVRASEKEMSVSGWISALIQSHVFQPPVLTTAELAVLNENNRQIRAIGVHLNQIARAFNQMDIDIRKLKGLDVFERVVKENLTVIDRVIRAANQSWGIGRGTH